MATAKKKSAKAKNPTLEAATAALKNAKSDQEKTVARSHLKAVKFQVLAVARVNKVLAALEQLQRLSNRNSYTYSHDQVEKIMGALSAKATEVTGAFTATGKTPTNQFSL